MSEQQEQMSLTPDQFKVQYMKRRVAETVARYEDEMAQQAVYVGQLESELRRAREELQALKDEAGED